MGKLRKRIAVGVQSMSLQLTCDDGEMVFYGSQSGSAVVRFRSPFPAPKRGKAALALWKARFVKTMAEQVLHRVCYGKELTIPVIRQKWDSWAEVWTECEKLLAKCERMLAKDGLHARTEHGRELARKLIEECEEHGIDPERLLREVIVQEVHDT